MSYLVPFVLVFFSPFSIAITSLGEERANLNAFRTFVRFVFIWMCRFPLPLGVWEGLRFVTVALPGLFSYLFCTSGVLAFTRSTSSFFLMQSQNIHLFFPVMIFSSFAGSSIDDSTFFKQSECNMS